MSNPSTPSYPSDDQSTGRRASMADALQRALRTLRGGGAAPGGGLSPDALNDLARSAGLTEPGQLADLSRLLDASSGGVGLDGVGVPQQIVFALQDAECALPAEAVQGVERLTDVTPVPNTVSWVLGVVQLRGSIFSVVDLRGFLGLPSAPLTPRSRLLLVTAREMAIGLLVDGVTEMRSLDDAATPTYDLPPPAWAAPYADRAVSVEGRTVIVLDPERLLYADKMHRYRADFG